MPYGECQRTRAGEPMANVVIVGGTEEAQLILRGLLRLHQHHITAASLSARTTLGMIRQATDPVLLVDAEMTEPSWAEFVPEAHRANPALRVVLLTPSRSTRLDSQARALGVAALVRRPFAIRELLTAVSSPEPAPPPAESAPAPTPENPPGEG
ncbi:MAG: response regulator [Thermoplasmata archaeon]|nr:response regulator [Thermoplasmata archaeon]